MSKKSNTKKIWTGIAIAAGAIILFKDQIKSSLGISGVDTEDLDRIKLLKDMGYFSKELMDPYTQREISRGAQRLREMRSRRVGPDAKEELAEVARMINNNEDYLSNAADWLVTGSYGSEFYYLTKLWLNYINTSGDKRLANAWISFVKSVVQMVILIEWPSLNASQLSKLWKMVDPAANAVFLDRLSGELADAIITNSGQFEDR